MSAFNYVVNYAIALKIDNHSFCDLLFSTDARTLRLYMSPYHSLKFHQIGILVDNIARKWVLSKQEHWYIIFPFFALLLSWNICCWFAVLWGRSDGNHKAPNTYDFEILFSVAQYPNCISLICFQEDV